MPFIRRDLLLVAGSCSVCWRLLTLIALSLGDSEDVAAGIFERSRACLSKAQSPCLRTRLAPSLEW